MHPAGMPDGVHTYELHSVVFVVGGTCRVRCAAIYSSGATHMSWFARKLRKPIKPQAQRLGFGFGT